MPLFLVVISLTSCWLCNLEPIFNYAILFVTFFQQFAYSANSVNSQFHSHADISILSCGLPAYKEKKSSLGTEQPSSNDDILPAITVQVFCPSSLTYRFLSLNNTSFNISIFSFEFRHCIIVSFRLSPSSDVSTKVKFWNFFDVCLHFCLHFCWLKKERENSKFNF